ncbi:MAG: SH3 domain-containing protein, partial [Burkholderiales bacterium]
VAVLYDAPSLKAQKLYLLGRDYPLEVVVKLENWMKVRDATGELAWVEKKYLSGKRTVLVTVPLADIRQTPDDHSPPVFHAEQNVLLELLEFSVPGWIKVRHRDGQTGYMRTSQVWGG